MTDSVAVLREKMGALVKKRSGINVNVEALEAEANRVIGPIAAQVKALEGQREALSKREDLPQQKKDAVDRQLKDELAPLKARETSLRQEYRAKGDIEVEDLKKVNKEIDDLQNQIDLEERIAKALAAADSA